MKHVNASTNEIDEIVAIQNFKQILIVVLRVMLAKNP
jgi:hypothetical protein